MTAPPDFSQPCSWCVLGEHSNCTEGICGCIEEHDQDESYMRGFKRLKRLMDPARPMEEDTLAKLPKETQIAILRHREVAL